MIEVASSRMVFLFEYLCIPGLANGLSFSRERRSRAF
jgi:hypothetical protein